jgi:uncharacterized tellurite resistance protein B-like protein
MRARGFVRAEVSQPGAGAPIWPMERIAMLDAIKRFFDELTDGRKSQDRFEEDDYRLAAVALMIHVLGIDGMVTERERAMLHGVVRYRFNLDDADAHKLVQEATEMEGEAVDLYRFTSLLNRMLDDEGRKRIVEMLWEMTYADGRVNEFEDNVMWRIADLLHVSSHDRLALRRQVAKDVTPPTDDPKRA